MNPSASDYLVIYIGEVLHVLYPTATKLKVAPDDIEEDIAHSVANVAFAVGGDPANIYLNRVASYKILFST